ncbi:hypothetical protein [Helicobacter sp. MIT 14-3879]|uniref:hypothetical protein n=1 Tax=Helicobacter sp. MIT 14-3879 TaxID=2040649 RepID=UPI000E1F269A|nr:hypothetical protein [Helicobacter sp. MIT 14-3879]RDU65204.1 hypothetical protein CQA44_02500 [Helicobacter sp. MIT 14-3879]
MKINILVNSILLEATLQSYLKDHIANYEECDFIIADEIPSEINKPICLIGFSEDSDIIRPFYKESLLSDLEKFNNQIKEIERIDTNKFNNILDLNELEMLKNSIDSINDKKENIDIKNEIENIVQDFTNRLYEVIKRNNAK